MTIDATGPSLSELGLLQRILLATDGTVTELIALYSGEEIKVRKLEQTIARREAPPELGCIEPARILHRQILLSGATRNFLFADSLFVFDRFSASMQNQLMNSDRPIGLLWKEERLETFREIVARTIEPGATVAKHFGLNEVAPFVSRTYLIHRGGKPLGRITEKWPLSAFQDADSARPQSVRQGA